ncbi:DUF4437 domain-containing protein [Mesorhizobium sp.]|uniref:DUF4437 domain-containing protein n=1 Tax=Mesorhizobium sp. TaxID=1871066 RepID=UPI00338D84C1
MPDQPHRLGPLWGKRDVGPAGTLLKVPRGWQAPIHAHSADYQGVVIEGTWSHWVPETVRAEASSCSPDHIGPRRQTRCMPVGKAVRDRSYQH